MRGEKRGRESRRWDWGKAVPALWGRGEREGRAAGREREGEGEKEQRGTERERHKGEKRGGRRQKRRDRHGPEIPKFAFMSVCFKKQ